MKTSILIGCLMVLFGAAARVLAVWPPETSLDEETPKGSARRPAVDYDTVARPRAIVERLDDDTRRLEIILADLKKDHVALKQHLQEKRTPAGEPQ